MQKKAILCLMLILTIALMISSCGINLNGSKATLPMETYKSSNGYSIDIPEEWTTTEDNDKVNIAGTNDQLTITITTELGGIDYFSLAEIKEQLTELLLPDIFSASDITLDEGGTEYFHRIIEGADESGARVIVEIYCSQPYETVRHYIVVVASGNTYDENEATIEEMISSFKNTFSEESYLILMDERRTAEAEKEAAESQENAEQTESEDKGAAEQTGEDTTEEN